MIDWDYKLIIVLWVTLQNVVKLMQRLFIIESKNLKQLMKKQWSHCYRSILTSDNQKLQRDY